MERVKEISQSDYYKVVGLLAVAHEWMARVNAIEQILTRMIEQDRLEENGNGIGVGGHCGDAIWSPFGADELLSKLKISVLPAPPSPSHKESRDAKAKF